MLTRKNRKRIGTVLQNSLHSLLQPLLNFGIAFIVIRTADETLWGAFVQVLIVVQLGLQVAAWGNKEYLIRAFSRTPAQITLLWQTNGTSRLVFLLVFIGIISVFDFPILPVFIWIIAGYITSSFDPLFIYQRKFLLAFAIEAAATTFIIGGLLFADNLDVATIIWCFALGTGFKAVCWMLIFHKMLTGLQLRFDYRQLRQASAFFLLGFSGLLASRIDLYTVSALLTEQDTGRYQIFINLMLYLQALAQFIMLPFLKSLYRLDDQAIGKIVFQLFIFGGLMLPFALTGAYVLFVSLYGIRFSVGFMILGGLFVWPVYAFLPLIHRLYKRDEQAIVLKSNIFGAGTNLLMNLILLPVIGLYGALLSSAIIQWGMLIYYAWHARKSDALPLRGMRTTH